VANGEVGPLEFRILGPLEVVNPNGERAQLPGQKTRMVLVALLLGAGKVVSIERLVQAAWGEDAADTAAKTLQTYVLQLRNVLEPARQKGTSGQLLVREEPGYRLRIAPDQLDAWRFERLVDDGRRALAESQPDQAARLLSEGLALWRGPALAGFEDAEFARPEASRFEELRLSTLEDRIQADLALGKAADLVPELVRLVEQQPLRERLWSQLMLALYRSGRQAEALRAYQRARTTLRDELGIDPSSELRRLEAAVLAQDPALDIHPRDDRQELPLAFEATDGFLVGRKEELHRLMELWRLTPEMGGRVVLVAGPEGIGKTRLVAEAAERWHAEGSLVLYGRAHGPTTPLQPIAEALASAGAATESVLGEVELREPCRAARALTLFLERRAGPRTAIVVLDDLDRADQLTIDVLKALVDECRSTAVLIVALVRDTPALSRRLGPGGETSVEADGLVLAPLDDDEVAVIASHYLGEKTSDSVAPLLAHTGGNPLRVHREAARLARSIASRRIGDASAQAATVRRDLDGVQREIIGGVLELQRLRDEPAAALPRPILETPDQGPAPICPYKGLTPFDFADAAFFYGREDTVAELVARVASSPFLAVVGPSGSGKSSVIRAGLLPSLRRGVLPGADSWLQLVLSPGPHPVQELLRRLGAATDSGGQERPAEGAIARACAALAQASGLLIVVDQLEEVFTLCPDEEERTTFLDTLVLLSQSSGDTVTIVVTLRSDHYGHCVGHPALARLLTTNQLLVGPLTEERLLRVIESPARRAGLKLDPWLAREMVSDVSGQPGGLPLLSTALREAWEHRCGRTLSLASYHQRGGVRGAVARLAESAYATLTSDQQRAARLVFRRLASTAGGSWARRRVAVAELGAEAPDVRAVITTLTDRRLLTTHDGMVEVAHEALFSEWPRLSSWLHEDLEQAQLRKHLHQAAEGWEARGRDASDLYRGARLEDVLDLKDDTLTVVERAYIEASQAAAESELAQAAHRVARQERLNRRLRVATAALGLVLAVAIVAAGLALEQRGDARAQATVAQSRGLASQSVVEDELDRALLLALEANKLDDSASTRSSLFANLLRSPQAIEILTGGGNRLQDLALNPSGTVLAVSDNHGTTYFWDTRTLERFDRPLERGFADSSGLAFSPDGSMLATTGVGPSGQGQVVLWDAVTHEPRGAPRGGLNAVAHSVAFNADSTRVAASDFLGKLLVWDVASGAVLMNLDRPGAGNTYVSLNGPGDQLISSDTGTGAVTFWDVASAAPIRSVPGMAQAHALSPDGALLATMSTDNTVYLYDVASGERRAALVGHAALVLQLAFSRDGRSLVSTSDDRSAIVWDIASGTKREVLRGHAGRVVSGSFSPDGKTLYTSGLDDKVFVWDLSGERRLARSGPGALTPTRRTNRTPPLAISPDLSLVAASADERAVTFRAVASGQVVGEPLGGTARLNRLAFSSDGTMLASTVADGTAIVWSVATSERVAELKGGHAGQVTTVAFAPGDKTVATGGSDGRVVLWDIGTAEALGAPLIARALDGEPVSGILNLSFSPDGRWLAATGGGADVAVWSLPRRSLRRFPADSRESIAIAFAPDSRTLVTGGQDSNVRFWDVESGQPVGNSLKGHAGYVTNAAYAPDGDVLATAGTDGTVILWDTRSGTPIGSPLPGLPPSEARKILRFAPDGQRLAVAYDDGRLVTWDLDPGSWRSRACAVAGRNLTQHEWRSVHGPRPYRSTCTQWPPGH
jgi:WD40 repeat protein/DNA-binding SARP family transcriptional activator